MTPIVYLSELIRVTLSYPALNISSAASDVNDFTLVFDESSIMDLRARLRAMIDARGLTQSEVADLADIPPETLSRILTGTTIEPGVYTLLKITHGMGETVGALLEEKGFTFDSLEQRRVNEFIEFMLEKLAGTRPAPLDPPPNAVELSVVSDSRKSKSPDAAAIPGLLRREGATRAFRASGDSMTAAGILHDDYLFVRPVGVPRMGAGKIVVCIVKGKTFVKKLEMSQRRIRLLSANERYAPIEVARDDISFVGVVLGRMGAPRG